MIRPEKDLKDNDSAGNNFNGKKTDKKLFDFEGNCGCSRDDIYGFEQNIRREINIRPGLWLSIINYPLKSRLVMNYKKKYPVVDFGFILSGYIKKNIYSKTSEQKEQHNKTGISGIQFSPELRGEFTITPREQVQVLHIHATLPVLKSLLKDDYSLLMPELKSVLEQNSQSHFSSIGKMTPDIQAVVYQILNPSGNAMPWHLYLEGKIMELISLQLAAISINNNQQTNRTLLTPQERKKIPFAKDILVSELDAPPTLKRLSTITGLSIPKMQAGFRDRYGKSVFNYFREHKMQTAKLLLDKAEKNVSETAWSVGYINVSHFSSAFKKRFGVSAGHYLRESLKKKG